MSARKKSKQNPPLDIEQQRRHVSDQKEEQDILSPSQPRTTRPEVQSKSEPQSDEASTSQQAAQEIANEEQRSKVRSSWYGGTWPRRPKASAVAQVAKDTYSATSDAVSDIVSTASRASNSPASSVRSPTTRIPRAFSGSNRSVPLAATTTKINITSNESRSPAFEQDETTQRISKECPGAQSKTSLKREPGSGSRAGGADAIDPQAFENPNDVTAYGHDPNAEIIQQPGPASNSWLGWFYQPTGVRSDASQSTTVTSSETSSKAPAEVTARTQEGSTEVNQLPDSNRSWMGVWRYSAPVEKEQKLTALPQDGIVTDSSPPTANENDEQANGTSKSKGWAFWSTEDSGDADQASTRRQSTGELALAGSPSQNRPEKALIDDSKSSSGNPPMKNLPKIQEVLLAKPSTNDRRTDPSSTNQTATLYEGSLKTDKKPSKDIQVGPEVKSKTNSKALVAENSIPKNLLLPSLASCCGAPPRSGLLQQFSSWLPTWQIPSTSHLETLPNPPKIRRALAIGVHGYFPTPLIRSVLGQPTGTSIRFANSAASAIQRWSDAQNFKCDIEKVALEGEGKIAERLDLLWNLLLNWIDKVRKADFILVACHSQGVPVANMLVAKLFSTGMIKSTRVAICAMAGVNMGPFPELRSRWIGGTAAELFEFGDPGSTVSTNYRDALETNIGHGVKITYIGSIDDQLVSMESSTFGPAEHPYIFRAVFIDGKLHAPNFLSHLVGFALKLRNMGVTDHGLIRELSSPLAGSLYSGEGHSKIYDDEAVYDLAIRFALETTNVSAVRLQMSRVVRPAQNPYILPFSMRGILEEDHVKNELHGEMVQLLKQFDDWKPSTKVLKDVKFRLEGVRSKI